MGILRSLLQRLPLRKDFLLVEALDRSAVLDSDDTQTFKPSVMACSGFSNGVGASDYQARAAVMSELHADRRMLQVHVHIVYTCM